jgi:hypothetical protein
VRGEEDRRPGEVQRQLREKQDQRVRLRADGGSASTIASASPSGVEDRPHTPERPAGGMKKGLRSASNQSLP